MCEFESHSSVVNQLLSALCILIYFMKQEIKFAQLVKRVREKLGLTVDEFAEKYNRNKSTIHCWETGFRTPPTKVLFDLLELDGQIVFYETECPTCMGTGIITCTSII